MGLGACFAIATGWTAALATPLVATLLVLLWNAAIYIDSSALTAGTVQAAEPSRRGATMGLHSMCGYAGGFIGPLGVGWALDVADWGIAFGHLALVTGAGFLALRWFSRGA